jgi:hypothetical protein
MNPSAPAAWAASLEGEPARNMVTATKGASGRALSARTNPNPSNPGRTASTITRSGSSKSTASRASRPLLVVPTTLLNGWYVSDEDVDGERVASVFTHELGHAANLGHTQVNGPLGYYSYTYAPKYPGVKGCVDPVYN